MDKVKVLPADLAAKYELKGVSVGKFNFNGFGVIDLEQVTVAEADFLVKRGFPYFKLIEKVNVPPVNSKASPAETAK